jgi:sec-independent protein translocase protein TatC
MVPVLFIAGAAFGYFVVLERAVQFLQNFNDDSFDILLQAKDYFKFAVLFVAGVGLLFQIPVGVLAITRLGIFTPRQLAKNRGYVILGIAVLAAVATPTPDPFTMSIAMAPLIVLFELSILLARWIGRIRPPGEDRWGEDDDDDDDVGGDDDGPDPSPFDPFHDDEFDDEYERPLGDEDLPGLLDGGRDLDGDPADEKTPVAGNSTPAGDGAAGGDDLSKLEDPDRKD